MLVYPHTCLVFRLQQNEKFWIKRDQKGELINGAELIVLKVDTKAQLHFITNEGSFSERVTDLQSYPQNIDGICNLLVDVLLHQLLTHPKTQAAHSDAPEQHELLISHS